MALDNKTKKFVDFYLSELLAHVKSMSEHRFAPIEYSIVKKVASSIGQSENPVGQIEAMASVPSLKAVCSFLQSIVSKIQQPDFKMSQMIALIESDSEKILQLFTPLVTQEENQVKLEKELHKVSVFLDVQGLKKTYARAAVEKTGSPTPVPTPILKTKSTEFGNVDDMIGFLSRRGKKAPEEKNAAAVPLSEEPESVQATENYSEGKSSDRSDFLIELEVALHAQVSALNQLKASPSKTRYIIEAADAFGLLKKTARIFELPRLRDLMSETEHTLNNIADNLDDRNLILSSESTAVLETMVDKLKQIQTEKLFPLKSESLNALSRLLKDFENSFAMRSLRKESEMQEPEETVPETKKIMLDVSHIAADDWQVYKEEAIYNFEIMTAAVEKLRVSASDAEAAKGIQQSVRALHASSKWLHLPILAAHYEILLSIFKPIIQRKYETPADLLELITASIEACSAWIGGDSISENQWLDINVGLTRFTDHKTALGAPKKIEKAQSTEIKAPKIEPEKFSRSQAGFSVLESNIQWIEEFQNILTTHNHLALVSGVEKQAEPVSVATAAPKAKAVAVVEPKPIEKPAEIKSKAVERSVEEFAGTGGEKTHVEIPDELVNAMAKGELEISDSTILNFVERLTVEPQDIVITAGRKVRKKKGAENIPVEDKQVVVPKEVVSQTLRGNIILQETNFASVDTEILDIFNQESEGYFKILDKSLEKLKTNIKDEASVKDLERISHSLKSSSRMLGFERVSGLSAAVELIAERCNENELVFTEELLGLMEQMLKAMRTIIAGDKTDVTSVVQKLFKLEATMLAPNIFTSHIPGALDMAVAQLEPAEQAPMESKTTDKAKVETAATPKAPEEKEIPAEPAPPENYFSKLGVDEEIVEIFKEESATYFKLMTNSIQLLQNDMTHEAAIHDIEKSAHSLRSSAKMLGFQKISNLVRPIETIAERISEGALDMDGSILVLFRTALERLQTLAAGTDADIENVLSQLSRIEKLPANAIKMDKRDSTQAIQSIKDQLSDNSAEEKKGRSQESKPVKQKAFTDDFDDIALDKDPILKPLSQEETSVLDEMSLSSQKEVR
jgi:chemotaxis protein histidine kinase CheA